MHCNGTAAAAAPASGEAQNDAQTGVADAATGTALPDVLEPTPGASTDANGIPSASATAPRRSSAHHSGTAYFPERPAVRS